MITHARLALAFSLISCAGCKSSLTANAPVVDGALAAPMPLPAYGTGRVRTGSSLSSGKSTSAEQRNLPPSDPGVNDERSEARAFVQRMRELARAGRWPELSSLMDPDPACIEEGCIVDALTWDGTCASTAWESMSFDPESIELFHNGDGFKTRGRITMKTRAIDCQFPVDVSRKDGAGAYYISILLREKSAWP